MRYALPPSDFSCCYHLGELSFSPLPALISSFHMGALCPLCLSPSFAAEVGRVGCFTPGCLALPSACSCYFFVGYSAAAVGRERERGRARRRSGRRRSGRKSGMSDAHFILTKPLTSTFHPPVTVAAKPPIMPVPNAVLDYP